MVWLFILKYWRVALPAVLLIVALGGTYLFVRSLTSAAYDRGVKDEAARWQEEYDMAVVMAREDQKEIDAAAWAIAAAEITAQRVIVENTRTIIREIPGRVPPQADAQCPIPLGFVRVFDAGASGSAAAGLAQRAPEPDDAPTDVVLSEIATVSASNAESCHGNARQLADLQAAIREFQALQARGE